MFLLVHGNFSRKALSRATKRIYRVPRIRGRQSRDPVAVRQHVLLLNARLRRIPGELLRGRPRTQKINLLYNLDGSLGL